MTGHRLVGGTVSYPDAGWPAGRGVVLPATGPAAQAAPVRLPPVQGDRKQLRETARRVSCVCLLDCSGSEYAVPGGDTGGFRFAVTRSLSRLMRRTGGGTMHVVHWGSRPTHAGGPYDVDRDHRILDRLLSNTPASMGGNDFPAALRMATTLLRNTPTDTIRLVFGITDGLEPVTPAMTDAITALGAAEVHLLLVPGDACPDDLAAQWQAQPIASFTRLPMNNTAMAHHTGRIYATAIGGTLPTPRTRHH